MRPRFDNVDDIRDDYFLASQALIDRHPGAVVLKTDCYNETERHGLKSIAGRFQGCRNVTCVDVDPAVVVEASARLERFETVSAVSGDIRRLAFADRTFDVVVDLSTIDHLPPADVPKALDEYHRVAQDDADLMVIVWLDEKGYDPGSRWSSFHQYIFEAGFFLRALRGRFHIVSAELLAIASISPLPRSELWKFHLRKKLEPKFLTIAPFLRVEPLKTIQA